MRNLIILFALAALGGCFFRGSKKPKYFTASSPEWSTIETREGMDFDAVWESSLDVLAKRFEMEMISKDGGYARTAWIHTWWKRGRTTENYRVRAILKISSKRSLVDIKTEAQYREDDVWISGFDTQFLETIKTDLMGIVGRTTR